VKAALILCLAAAAASAAPAAGIRVNQTGFAPLADKIAVVPDGAAGSFEVIELRPAQAGRPVTPSSPALVNWKSPLVCVDSGAR
jgi:hypothetical protein